MKGCEMETPDNKNNEKQEDETVYKYEVILSWLGKKKITPVTLGLGFFLLVPLPLTAWSIIFESNHFDFSLSSGISYIENISWSFSAFYLFPFILVLSMYYYKAIPDLFFNHLIGKVVFPRSSEERFLKEYKKEFFGQFNQWWLPVAAFLLAIGLTTFYLIKVKDTSFDGWLFQYTQENGIKSKEKHITAVGIYAAFIQVVLVYWIINLVYRALIFSKLLNELFSGKRFTVKLNPAHEDNACGLSRIFQVSTMLNVIIFLIGIYMSLIVIDKWVIQDVSLLNDMVSPVMLASYALLAPLLFFLPLWAPHNEMRDAKDAFIKPVCNQMEKVNNDILATDECDKSKIKLLSKLRRERLKLLKQIPVWPFDIRSINTFFGAIIMPVVPTSLPIIVELITKE
jgi:hypothetical protein